MRPHWHASYELLMVYEGDCRLTVCESPVRLTPPCMILYRPFILHRMSVDDDSLYVRSMVNFTAQDAALFSERLFSLSFLEDAPFLILPITEAQCRGLDGWFQGAINAKNDFSESRLFIGLLLHFVQREAERLGLPNGKIDFPYISGVLEHLSSHLDLPLQLESTAELFHVGRTKLNEDLRRVTGMTFKRYLTLLRMAHAKEMLSHGCSVIDTALSCGYGSESHFIDSYRRYWGHTPGEEGKEKKKE